MSKSLTVESILRERGLTRVTLASALAERMANDHASLNQALEILGFGDDETAEIVVYIVETFGVAMRAASAIQRLCN